MQVRIRTTGQVMYESEFRAYTKAHGGPSWETTTTEILDNLGADVVFEGPQANPTRYQVAFADGVEQTGGKWYTKWSVVDMDAEAVAAKDAEQAKSVRERRNALLVTCDCTQLPDFPVDKVAWAVYRQALRDISKQEGFPWTVEWPTVP